MISPLQKVNRVADLPTLSIRVEPDFFSVRHFFRKVLFPSSQPHLPIVIFTRPVESRAGVKAAGWRPSHEA